VVEINTQRQRIKEAELEWQRDNELHQLRINRVKCFNQKFEEYSRLLKKIKDMMLQEFDKFIAAWNSVGIKPMLEGEQATQIRASIKVRTRALLSHMDALKDRCFVEKDECAAKFRHFIRSVPFHQLIEDENSSAFQEILKSETPNLTGIEKTDKIIMELNKMCESVKEEMKEDFKQEHNPLGQIIEQKIGNNRMSIKTVTHIKEKEEQMTVNVSHANLPKNLLSTDGDGRERMVIKTIHIYPDNNPPNPTAFSFPSTPEDIIKIRSMPDPRVVKFVQVRRQDKRAIGYQMVFANGETISYGMKTGKSVSEVNLTEQPKLIEVTGLQKADNGGKSYIKITFQDSKQGVIDTCLLYTSSVAGSFLTSFSGWEGFTEWKGKRIELQDG